MMFTLLCPMLLLDSWTNALPQQPYKISHLQPLARTKVSLNDDSNESTAALHNILSRQSRQSSWVYPTFNPPSSYSPGRRTSSSSGLAYRSIIPQSSNHYTNYYRNRNLFTGGDSRRRQQGNPEGPSRGSRNENDINSEDAIYSSPITNIYIHTSPSQDASPGGERTYDVIVNSNYNNNPDLTISSAHTSTLSSGGGATTVVKVPSSLDTSPLISFPESGGTTAEPRSAPATDALSTARLSSTLQMQIGEDEEPDIYGDVGERDAIGFGGSDSTSSARPESKDSRREPKGPGDPLTLADEQDSMIVFPGNASRSSENPLKRNRGDRPGKSSLSDDDDDDEAYVPPLLKTLAPAAFQSLRRLIEARRRVVGIDRRDSSKNSSDVNNSSSYNNRVSQSPYSAQRMERLEITRVPSCAAESGYCEEIETYPKDFLNQVLKKSVSPDVFQEVFGDSIENNTVATDLVGRNDLQDTPLCNSVEHTIYPKVAKNREGKFMYVVNHDDYIQGVRVEKCLGENNQCMFQEGNPTGYQSTCRQKFIYKKLLAFTPEGKAMTDTFRLPSCCVCYLRSAFVGDRINAAGLSTSINSNTNDQPSSKGDESGGVVPKSSDSDQQLSDDNTSKSTTASPNSSTVASTAELMAFPTTVFASADEPSDALPEIVHDETFLDDLDTDLLTHGFNDSMTDVITTGPFFRSF